jgi:hypothetical protein
MPPSDYEPEPIDTSGVQFPPELDALVERLAENAHAIWARKRIEDGWRFGPARDDRHKQHPSLVPYEQLDDAEKGYDRSMARGVLEALLALGYRISPQ